MSDRTRKWLAWGLAIAVVAGVFLVIIPKMADLQKVWEMIRDLGPMAIAALVAVTAWNQVTYWWVAMAALPGLRFTQAAVMNLSSTAVANTVPAGGGVGVGVSTAILRSWGFSSGDVGRYVLVSGIWNNFVKLGLPIVALALLAATGESSSRLVIGAFVGVAVLVASIVGLVALLRSESTARRMGGWIEKVVNLARRVVRKDPVDGFEDRAADFREDSRELTERRWHVLTATAVVGHLSLYLVLLVTLRVLGIDADSLTWIEVLAGYAFARLITAIPITPGGVGLIELGYVGAFTQFGADKNAALAAVLVFRTLTYLLPIPLGALTYAIWNRRSDWREEDERDKGVDALRDGSEGDDAADGRREPVGADA